MTRLRPAHTPDGRRLEASHVIAAPAADAWDLLVDVTRWPAWSPVVSDVEATDRRLREGTRGRIRVPGVWLPFRVTRVAGRRWDWRVAGVAGATHRVDDLEADRCRVAFELPPSAAGYVPICLEALERMDELLTSDRSDVDGTEPDASAT
ncbi:SRPBCC family protein [Halobiforma nitratireducens]|uniref:Polyketide cyclase/dehydrase n=1 Tax=Halobiforma nitratireducens JCM 10879 TaxID=1227454 RepID=M0L7A1_9EURY|nr:SRPBCC family protein [Halobiforma nitratireducens]EMA29426.1 polyketide cyclase/dehydrase [Halobiforma nitratireducens JCM 10879]